jgi:hypothetical protein
MVICADAKPSIQARGRIDPTAPRHRCGGLVEHESERLAAVTYFAASHLRPGQAIGRTEPRAGLPRFDRLVLQVITKEPHRLPPARVLDRRQRLRPPAGRRRSSASRTPKNILPQSPRDRDITCGKDHQGRAGSASAD